MSFTDCSGTVGPAPLLSRRSAGVPLGQSCALHTQEVARKGNAGATDLHTRLPSPQELGHGAVAVSNGKISPSNKQSANRLGRHKLLAPAGVLL